MLTKSMRCSRILFDKLKVAHQILITKAAYVLAERELTEWQVLESKEMTPEDLFVMDAFGNARPATERDKILHKMADLEEQGRKALDDEDYMKVKLLKEVYNVLKNKLK